MGYPLSYLKSGYSFETFCAREGLPCQAPIVMSQLPVFFDHDWREELLEALEREAGLLPLGRGELPVTPIPYIIFMDALPGSFFWHGPICVLRNTVIKGFRGRNTGMV
jgi:hypothetical protein